ncbi:MAG: hypothetical protein RKO24_09400 [Candidatus Competibacter sp.]|nr:hypothetical protein [Candidatus Contendobacter sp.]MDS4069824.1 hypothetical protein [Candidatus Competibacter sp.]
MEKAIQQALAGRGFTLVLQGAADVGGFMRDLAPGIEQILDPVADVLAQRDGLGGGWQGGMAGRPVGQHAD